MITIRKSVKQDLANQLPLLISESLKWMSAKYPNVNFSNVDYIFSASYNRSRYFRNEVLNGSYLTPNVCICTRETLYLYKKPSLGLKKFMLKIGSVPQIMCALIHELTHHVQYETNIRKGNELDTTNNELQYLKEFHEEYYKQLTSI